MTDPAQTIEFLADLARRIEAVAKNLNKCAEMLAATHTRHVVCGDPVHWRGPDDGSVCPKCNNPTLLRFATDDSRTAAPLGEPEAGYYDTDIMDDGDR